MADRVITGDKMNLVVPLHPAQKDNNTITAPNGCISSLVHASMLLLPSAEGVGQEAVSRQAWLCVVPPCQHDATDVQFPSLTYMH